MRAQIEGEDLDIKVTPFTEGKFLIFRLAEEEYGIGILRIKEIIGVMPITSVPRTPDFVEGVINLRGKVIPIVNLRLRFGMEQIELTDKTCIIVVEITGGAESILIGIIVDSVSEVVNVPSDQIEEVPPLGGNIDTKYILGMAKMEEKVKILLDIDRVLNQEEVDLLKNAL